MVNRTVRIWDEDIAARTELDRQNKTTGPGNEQDNQSRTQLSVV
jgi:hypothetical protein